MHENMRVSDTDREQVAEQLREHFTAGRLTSEELDERVTATLSAKTVGDLRAVMADLPGPRPLWQQAEQERLQWPAPSVYSYRRGPRFLPLALILLFAVIVLPPAGFVFLAFLKVILMLWLVACVAAILAAGRVRHRARRHWQSGGRRWYHDDWRD
jgi:hypothetical protein